MKVLSLRLRGMKGELEELGESTEGVENISKMQGQIYNMTGGKVNIFDANGDFRSTYDIMKDIAAVYNDLTDTDRASLLETIAGKDRANDVASLLQNMSTAVNMVETAENSAGSARGENEKYLDSLQGRLDVLTSSIQAFSAITLDSGFLKGIVSGATEAIDIFSALIENVGVFPTLLGAVGAGFSVFGKGAFTVDSANGKLKLFGQNLSDIKNLFSSLFTGNFGTQFNGMFGNVESPFAKLNQQMQVDSEAFAEYHRRYSENMSGEQLTSALNGASSELKQYMQNTQMASQSFDDFSKKQKQIAVATQAQNKSFKSSSAIIQEYNNGCRTVGMSQEDFVQAVSSTNPVMGSYLSNLNGARGSMTGYATSLIGATAKTVGLTVASTALNAALTMGIGVAIGAVISGISSLITYYDDLAESVEASSSAFDTANSELMNNKAAFDEAVQSYEKLRNGINKATGENISLSTEEYEEYQNAVSTIADSVPSVVAGFDAQGNAILNTTTNVEDLTSAYNELIAAENRAFVEGDEAKGYVGKDKVMEDYIHDLKDMQTSDLESYQILQELLEANDVDAYLADLPKGDLWNLRDRLTEMGMKETNLSDADNIARYIKENTEEVRSAVNEQMSEYEDIASEMKQITSSMLAEAMYSDEDIMGMDESIQNLMTQYVGSLDGAFFETLVNENNGNKNKAANALEEHINGIVSSFKGLSESQQQSIADAFDMQIDFNAGEVTMDEFAKKAQEVDEILQDIGLDEAAKEEIMLSLGFEYDDDGNLEKWTSDYETALNRLGGDGASKNVQEWLGNLSGADLAIIMDLELDGDETVDELQHALDLAKALQGVGSIDIQVESDNLDKLNTALEESDSATGLASESMDALNNMYADLDGYDPSKLFERTANGIHLNAQALREYQSEYEKTNKENIAKDLQTLNDEYDRLTKALAKSSSAGETAILESQREDILNQISNVADLAAQYDGLTSSYNKWLQAQSGSEQGDMYDAMYGGIESTEELYDKGLVGTNEFREFVQMMTDEDLTNASTETIVGIYEKGLPKMKKYFTEGAEGAQQFLKDVENINSEWAHQDANGNWEFDFGEGNDEEIAKALGLSTEQVQSIIRKLNDYGFEVDIDSEFTGLEDLKTKAEEAQDTLQDLASAGEIDFAGEFNFETENIDYLEEQITDAIELLNQFRNEDGTIDIEAEGAQEAQTILATLLQQKMSVTQPAIMQVHVDDPSSEVGQAITTVQELYSAIQERSINIQVGANTENADSKISSLVGQLNELRNENPEVYAQLGLNTSEFNSALSTLNNNVTVGAKLDAGAVSTIQAGLSGISADVLAKIDGIDTSLVDGYQAPDKTATAKYNVDSSLVDAFQPPTKSGTALYTPQLTSTALPTLHGTAQYTRTFVGSDQINGTAHANGNINGKAFKQGSWGAKSDGTALMGELGPEIIVRGDKWFTVGDNGAGFYSYKKGDIIFNHIQSRELLENGYVTSSNGRGRAFVEGTAFSSGSGGFWGGASSGSSSSSSSGSSTTVINNNYYGSSSSSSKSSSSKSSSSKSSTKKATEEAEEFEEKIDWIEVAIDRLERAIDKLDLTASSTFKTWTSRTSALNSQILKTREEIDLQQKAYNRYIKEANSVGLSSAWANKVKNGKVDIETITDENLKEKIDEYQEWYEKALDAKDAIDELKEAESELYNQRFENVSTRYEGILAVIQREQAMLEEGINQSETKGWVVSTEYYSALIENQQKQMAELEKQRKDMMAELDAGVESGAIAKYSETWYSQVEAIDEVSLAIKEGQTALEEYGNSIRDINWSIFDMIQDRISAITTEADFLIDLMDNKQLYEDNGQLTDEGKATMGLHGQNYNVYMGQADRYGEEIAKLDSQIASDPYDQELLERRQELLELQQESILNAEEEKNAIRDMVEEGIELELDALQELIDKRNEALDSAQDLYEYQQDIAEQTKEISELEKQMAAIRGDDSEEAMQRVQEIKVELEEARKDLEETEYDRYISDQQKLLDELYNEYELILNTRLDNIDALISDMILEINTDAATINETINNAVTNVGYTLSDEMRNIWDVNSTSITNGIKDGAAGVTSVITKYGDGFNTALTTVNSTLNNIGVNIANMITQLNKLAKTDIKAAGTSSAANKKPSTSTSKPSTSKPSTSTNKGGDGVPKVGDRVMYVSGAYYYDSYGTMPAGSYKRGQYVYITHVNTKGSHPYHISTGKKLGSGDLGWLKLSQLSGYAMGKEKIIDNEYAWTQENGREMVVRPSDGAILTPLAKNDSVLNAAASSNIWDMANDPAEFIKRSLGVNSFDDSKVVNGGSSTYTQNFENITFNMPNVKNYEQLLSTMQKDRNFERLIDSMTIDRVAGKSSIAKKKAIR